VVGLDISREHLSVARRLVGLNPECGRIDFVQGDMMRLPLGEGAFDWAWCADALWAVPEGRDPTEAVRELARIVKPGGTVAVLLWPEPSLLTGHAELQARLNRAFASKLPHLQDANAQESLARVVSWFRGAGIERVSAWPCVSKLQAPLSREMREAITFCFSMFWGDLQQEVSADDWGAYRCLCDPESGGFILDEPGYFGFLSLMVFVGRA
jgi:demethylmenaquinone methyltransferase/2-methoxy-6-polyprenyl-1,4-benzoquinol methylase